MFGNILHFTRNRAKRLDSAVGKRFKTNCDHVYTNVLLANSFPNRITKNKSQQKQIEIYTYKMKQVNLFLKQEGISVKDELTACQHVWGQGPSPGFPMWLGAGAMVGGSLIKQVWGTGDGDVLNMVEGCTTD